VQKFRSGFTHNPFALRIDNRPNREAIALAIREKRLPISSEAVPQLAIDLSIANQLPRPFLGNKSSIDKYRQSVADTAHLQRQFSKAIEIEAFYHEPGDERKVKAIHEGKPVVVREWVPQLYTYTSRGIEIRIDNQTYAYHVLNQPAWEAGNIGAKFSIKYNADRKKWSNGRQPDEILLYHNSTPVHWQGTHLALVPNERMPMAVALVHHTTQVQVYGYVKIGVVQLAPAGVSRLLGCAHGVVPFLHVLIAARKLRYGNLVYHNLGRWNISFCHFFKFSF
jgi:hypothetical protein